MLTKFSLLHLVFALMLATTLVLTSCPEKNAPANSNANATAPVAGKLTKNPVVVSEPTDQAPMIESEPVVEKDAGQTDSKQPASKTKADDEDNGTPADEVEEKQPMSKNYRAPVEESRRPAKQATHKESMVSVEMRLISAEFNESENATLSRLELEFRANLGRMKKLREVVELDDINKAVVANFDLDLCRIEIYPIVQPPEFDGRGSLGSIELVFEGTYQIRVYLENDELIGIFGIYPDGTFGAAPWGQRPEGFLVKSMKTEDSFGPKPFTISRKAAVGGKPENLLTIQYNGGGFKDIHVYDPDGNRYQYRFPAGVLEMYDPNEV